MMQLLRHLLLLIAISGAFSKKKVNYFKAGEIKKADPGPSLDTVYKPGTPGGDWTDEEVDSTRKRILQMIHPHWAVKKAMYTSKVLYSLTLGPITENTLMRLVFHDCIPYSDLSGGCDGCLNWSGVTNPHPSSHLKEKLAYTYDPNVTTTDNNGLDQVAEKLELIYKMVDWPFKDASLEVSLCQSGKSRAHLWQLAGLVALERTAERANIACQQDFTARQQIRLLEGENKCEIKLTKPLKFLTGRSDCVTEDGSYKANKDEIQPMLYGDGNHIVDYGREKFKMDAEHWVALQAIHGVVHQARLGVPYTWFGSGYLGNMYFKWIAETPRYLNDGGGDLSFDGNKVYPAAVGGPGGKPVKMNGWRASCMYAWKTPEGGPCFMRPTPAIAGDSPNPDQIQRKDCVIKSEKNGHCEINKRIDGCEKAKCENFVLKNAKLQKPGNLITSPWTPDASDINQRHAQGWNNQFGLPYEIGLYWNMTVGGPAQRGTGCPGLTDFGTQDKPNWPYRNNGRAIFNSPAMKCGHNNYVPDTKTGKPMHQIVDEMAQNNEVFVEKFLEGWQMMTSNGYQDVKLKDGPQSGWLGYYSLKKQNKQPDGDFEAYIKAKAPLRFTDPKADPFICGHKGHAATSCGFRFSSFWKIFAEKGVVKGDGDDNNLHYE